MTDEAFLEELAKVIDPRGWAMLPMGDEDAALDQPYQQHVARAKAKTVFRMVRDRVEA
jgi:hypothetical protein